MHQTEIGASCKELLENTLIQESAEFKKEDVIILATTAESIVVSYEILPGEIRATLKTKFRLIYSDREGKIGTETSEKESYAKIPQTDIERNACVYIHANVCEVTHRGNNPVVCQATVELTGWHIQEQKITFLNSCLENTYCKSQPIRIESTRCLTPGGLTLSFSDETKMNIVSLVDYHSQALVTNVYPSDGLYRIEGDCYIRIVAQNEDGLCFTQVFSHPFGTEITDSSVTAANDIDVSVAVQDTVLSLSEDDKRNIIFDLTLDFSATASSGETVESVTDVYSVTDNLTVEESLVTLCNGFCVRSLRDKASALFTPKDGINELFGVLLGGVTVSYNKNNGLFVAEGIIQTHLLYKNGNDLPSSVTVELPYQVNIPVDYVCNTKLQPEIIVTNLTARMRSGGETDILCELIVTVKGIQSESVRILSDIQIGDKKEPDDYAITLYLVRPGETLWDVAKALNTSEQILREQNPDIGNLVGGEKIILYREMNFDEE